MEETINHFIRKIKDYLWWKYRQTGITDHWNDETYLRRLFRWKMGRRLNLENPQTFNEKLQWLKLNDHNPEYTKMVDKYEAKKYVAGIIGEEYIVPTLGIWEHFEEIDFEGLPDRFVLKCTHDSGGVVICNDKKEFDIEKAKEKLNRSLNRSYYLSSREWPYKNVKPRIIAEKYIENDSGMELVDYKLMCFNGKVKCSFICSRRYSKEGLKVTFYDREWKLMPFERHYQREKKPAKKPENYEKMLELAERLSYGIPFVRVDFYNVDGRVLFGEMTFYPGSGIEEFSPEEWDYELGSWIQLPSKKGQEQQ